MVARSLKLSPSTERESPILTRVVSVLNPHRPIHWYLVNELKCAVIYPNVRGSSGYGKKFMAADDVEKREDSVK